MTSTTRRVRVLRGVEPQAADLGTVRAQSARHLVVDPELVQGATDDGYRVGYQAGFDAGLLDAATAIDVRERQRAADLRSTLTKLEQSVTDVADNHARMIETIDSQIIALAAELAEVIIGRELAATSQAGFDALRRALQFAPHGAAAVAHLHPDDIQTLGDTTAVFGHELTIQADPSLDRGDCFVDIDSLRIDVRIQAALQRVRESVTS